MILLRVISKTYVFRYEMLISDYFQPFFNDYFQLFSEEIVFQTVLSENILFATGIVISDYFPLFS